MASRSRLSSALQILIGGHVVAAGLATYLGNETWYRDVLIPAQACLLGPERAHRLAIKAASYGLVPHMNQLHHPELATEVLGMRFANPIGLAAGCDKHGEAVDGMLRIGFGFVEVGTVTPQPQEGNPTPRVFRLLEDRAVINRYGFNSDGHFLVSVRLHQRRDELQFEHGVVGVNLGRNKTTPVDREMDDYVEGVKTFGSLADYLVINISSPNTPGLRSLQGREQLRKLVCKVVTERNKLSADHRPPIFIKIAPDLTDDEKKDIASVVTAKGSGVDGLIICNTTITRPPSLQSPGRGEVGGLSGVPIKDLATNTVRDMYRLTNGKVVIIGVGGISSGQDAYDKIRSGASLIQLYTALVYDGPPLVPRIANQLAELLRRDGFKHVSEAVGVDVKR